MSKENGKVSFVEKLGFMSYSTSANIVFNFKSLYYLIFLTNVLKIPVLTAGWMMTLGTVWDFVNDPIIGVWSNNIKFKSGEKIRPYLLWIAIPWAAGMVLLFTDFDLAERPAVVLSLVIFFFYEIANTFRGIVYNGMGGLATQDYDERKSINAFRSLGGCLGSGIGAVAVTPLVKLFGGLKEKGAILGKGDAKALFLASCVMALLMIFGCFFHYFTTRERVAAEEEKPDDKTSFAETYRILFGCKSWVWNMFYIMGYGICNSFIMSAINYYAAYILGSSAASTPILAAYLVTSVILSVLTPKIESKLGRRNTMFLGVLIPVLGKIPFMINPYSAVNIYINAITTGIGGTITFIMFNVNRNSISDLVEVQSRKRLDAMVSTGDNLASKIAEAGVAQIMAYMLNAAGFDESLLINQTAATRSAICAFLGWIPCIVLALMTLAIYFLDIDKEMKESKEKRGLTA